MASDELYKLAVEFDKKKLWNKLDSDQIFGLKLADGRIIYCSVRGKYGEENYALAVYVDTEGLNSLRHSEIGFGKIADNEIFLLDVSQNCLQVIFEVKDALSEEELKAERAFTRRNKIYFRKKYSHPRFLKFTPLCLATQIKNLEDEKILSQAILAAIEVAKKFPEKLPRKITFSADVPIRRKFPLLTFDGENYKWTMQNFPPFRRVNYPEANLNPKNLKKLSVAKKSGSYCCDIFILPLAVKDDDGKKKFSVTLMTYDKTKKRVIEIEPATNYIDAPENLTLSVAKAFIKNGVPKKIFVRNERSYIFLEKFCEQLGIELCESEKLPKINAMENRLLEELKLQELSSDEEYISQLLDIIFNTPAEELKKNLPRELKDLLEDMYHDDILSDEMDAKIEKILFD